MCSAMYSLQYLSFCCCRSISFKFRSTGLRDSSYIDAMEKLKGGRVEKICSEMSIVIFFIKTSNILKCKIEVMKNDF